MSELDKIQPTERLRVIDLVEKAGVDVKHWADYKGTVPASNPKYCYNWSFEQPGERVVVCLWHAELEIDQGKIVFKYKPKATSPGGSSGNLRKIRENKFATRLEIAYRQKLPVNVIVLEGEIGNEAHNGMKSRVHARLLDTETWSVRNFDYNSGGCHIIRGEEPCTPSVPLDSSDAELSWFEGNARKQFIYHRRREGAARREKIRQALAINGGRLKCEVPGCGFDFVERYGVLGEGYAQVHHLRPLKDAPKEGRKTNLADLAVVCPNCHAMIHIGGECRPMDGLILSTTR